MAITYANKELSTDSIECGGTFDVTLTLTAEPDLAANPADIALMLDRSGSMSGQSLTNLKRAAKRFIDLIDEASDGTRNGKIGNGSRIGLVSFATTATQDVPLSTSVSTLKNAVDTMTAGGSTNHADAFTKGYQLFRRNSSNAKVMVMFTDGKTTVGGDPNAVATAAKNNGATVYAVGLAGNGGIDEDALRCWVSDPASDHLLIAPASGDLEEMFEDLARQIASTGATNIELTDTVDDCFRITAVDRPSEGRARRVSDTAVRWQIDELGVDGSETATLEFTVQHTGDCTGTVAVNESIDYTDDQDNEVEFPSPTITVDCDDDDGGHCCPSPVEVSITGCGGTVTVDAAALDLDSPGHILQLNVTLHNVCADKRVALAAWLTELDDCGREHARGLKTITVPAHHENSCRDVTVRCLQFVLPRDLDVSGSEGDRPACAVRSFRARFLANYIDQGFACGCQDEDDRCGRGSGCGCGCGNGNGCGCGSSCGSCGNGCGSDRDRDRCTSCDRG